MKSRTFKGAWAALALAMLVMAATSANAAIIIDDSLGINDAGFNTTLLTASYDASGSDKLVVTASMENKQGSGPISVTGMTYGGVSLTEAIQSTNSWGVTAIYYLDDPGAAGDIVVSRTGGTNGMGGSVVALSGTAAGVGPTNRTPGVSTSLTTTVDDSLVVASHYINGPNNGNGVDAPTADAPLTQLFSSRWGGNRWAGAASGYQFVSPAGSVTPTFTSGTADPATVAAAFTPSGPSITPVTWDNGSTDGKWETAINWDRVPDAEPDDMSLCTIDIGGVVDLSEAGELAYGIELGETTATTLNVSGDLTVSNAVNVHANGTLTVDGTLNAATLVSSGTLGGSGTISAPGEITGIVAPGSSTGVLTFDPGAGGFVEFDVENGDPSYHVEFTRSDAAVSNDLIVVAAGSLVVEGEVNEEPKQTTLNLSAISQLGPDDSWFGTQVRTIIQKGENNNNEDPIDGEFEEVPVGSHLGYGAFVEAPGVEVTAAGNMEVTLLQALAGDTNGDRVVDIATDGSALILNLGTQTAMDWTNGDFNHDQAVDIGNDGSALILNLGRAYKGGVYKGGSPGEGKDVSPGEGGGHVDQDGSIFLEMQDLALYSVYVGNDEGEQLRGTDALSLDAGVNDPVWVLPPFSTVNNAVDNPVLEAFEEMMTGGDFLTSQPYDTLVNVNFDGLIGEATSIWLKYQQLNQPAAITQLYRVPEPGTLVISLGTGLLGLLWWRRRE